MKSLRSEISSMLKFLNIEREITLQTLSVLGLEFLFLQCGAFLAIIWMTYLLLFTNYYWITLLYIAWIAYDSNKCYTGGRFNAVSRGLKVWEYYCQYFPINLVKTVDLDPNVNYIFAVHPHGIMCLSGFGNFCTDATGFSKLFPGLKPHVLMLKWMFYLPITRELLLLTGASAVAKQSFKAILDGGEFKENGQICVVVVGGAAESLEAIPDKYRLILRNRKGFVKIAIETGASLVPVFSFGENNLFNQLSNPNGSFLRRFQEKLKKTTAIGFPAWYGKGLFENSFGFLPLKNNVNTVVGKPIYVKKNSNPTREEVNELHDVYISELVKLFDDHKDKYCTKPTVLEII